METLRLSGCSRSTQRSTWAEGQSDSPSPAALPTWNTSIYMYFISELEVNHRNNHWVHTHISARNLFLGLKPLLETRYLRWICMCFWTRVMSQLTTYGCFPPKSPSKRCHQWCHHQRELSRQNKGMKTYKIAWIYDAVFVLHSPLHSRPQRFTLDPGSQATRSLSWKIPNRFQAITLSRPSSSELSPELSSSDIASGPLPDESAGIFSGKRLRRHVQRGSFTSSISTVLPSGTDLPRLPLGRCGLTGIMCSSSSFSSSSSFAGGFSSFGWGGIWYGGLISSWLIWALVMRLVLKPEVFSTLQTTERDQINNLRVWRCKIWMGFESYSRG